MTSETQTRKARKIAIPVQSDGLKLYLQKGRLWTGIEHAILLQVCESVTRVDHIHKMGALPVPVVHAALLRLMGAGWAEFVIDGESVGFQATEYGRAVSSYDTLPRVSRETSRHEYFVVDQLLGAAFRRNECSRLHWEQHLPEDVLLLEREIPYTPSLKASIAEELVREDETLVNFVVEKEHIRREQYLIVERIGSMIRGLPISAPTELKESILDRSDASRQSSKVSPPRVKRISDEKFKVVFDDRHVVSGGRGHRALLLDFVSNAKQYICIHSTFLSGRSEQLSRTQKELLPLFKKVTSDGVHVDILWGQNEADGWAVYETWKSFILENELEELVRLHSVSTLSHAKFVLADFGGGRFRLAVGSCNWLASPFRKLEISLAIEDQRFIGRFLREFSSKLRGHHLSVEGEFHKSAFLLSGELLRREPEDRVNAEAELVIGQEHQSVYLEYVDTVRDRLVIASHRLGRNALNAIFVPLESGRLGSSVQVEIYYELLADISMSELRDIQSRVSAVKIKKLPPKSFHGKFMCKDSHDVVVTSQNLLSATPLHQDGLDEIGVRIQRKKIANVLLGRFSGLSSQSQTI